MARARGFFNPSERSLEFGAQYATVLARWGELFTAAAALAEANVALGRMTSDASKEFEQWVQQTASAPWAWLDPRMMQRFTQGMAPKPDKDPS